MSATALGRVRQCVRKKRGPSGQMRCAKYKPIRGGKPGRVRGKGAKRVCVRTKRGPSGQRRCAKYR